LITKFQNVYRPEKLLTIHEPIWLFRGHIYFCAYTNGNPTNMESKFFKCVN
jgi:hypothetical protein